MKNGIKFLTLLASAILLVGCSQPAPVDPDGDDEDKPFYDPDNLYTPNGHKFVSTRVEAQYRSENADYTLGGVLDRTVDIFKDADSLINSKNAEQFGSQTFYSMWTFHEETENFGFDPFLEYDDEFFEDHLLIVGAVSLPKDTELYFINLDTELQKRNDVNSGNPFYAINFDEVSPTDEIQSSSTERPVYFFIPIDIPEGETVSSLYTKYSSDPIKYIYWEVHESTLTHSPVFNN